MSDVPMSDLINVLLEWCAAKGILIDTRISIGPDHHGGIGVHAHDHLILPGETLVRIPKNAVLSVRTCSLAGFIPINPYGLGAQLSLTCALYVEILKGERSHWSGYIRTLPTEIVDLPLFWGVESDTCGDGSGTRALTWLTGTEVGKILQHRTDSLLTTLEEIDRFYWNVAEPLLSSHSAKWSFDSATSPTLKGFHRAFSLVSSRAFLVDAYHGLSMVPVADVFNHVVQNDIHLETDYDVCPECGSLQECPHDKDGGLASDLQIEHNPKLPMGSHDQYFEMVSDSGIPPEAEVFNTYGEKLTNAQLLTQYGFILEENENDHLSWTLEKLVAIFSDHGDPSILKEVQDFLSAFSTRCPRITFHESDLVYGEASEENLFRLNEEGNISHRLWIGLLALSLHRHHRLTNKDDAYQTAQMVFSIQIQLESLDRSDEEGTHFPSELLLSRFDGSDTAPFELLREISRMCITLCKARRGNSGKSAFGNSNLFDVLEETPEDDRRTRLAVSILISERSLLDACEARWLELSRVVEPILRGLC